MMKKQVLKVITSTMAVMLLCGISSYGQELFSTIFNEEANWGNPGDGSWTGYNEKTYAEGDWFFHSTESVRGTAAESYGGSAYSFRDRDVFSIHNTGAVSGMAGFSMQLRDWMLGSGEQRNLKISLDGGDSWETIFVINKNWFDAYQVYQEYIYYFPGGAHSFAAEDFMIELDGGGGTNNGRINIGQFVALGESSAVITPSFSPNGGTFFAPVEVSIESATAGATIFFSTIGEDGPWTEYTSEVLVSETTTIWAYATADDMDDSNVAHATFTFPAVTEVATLAALRDMPVDGTMYKYTGDAVIVAMDSFRNRKFIQDETAAMLIDDQPGTISTPYDLYDVITNVVGQLNVYYDMLRFQPEVNTEPATQNTPVEPAVFEMGAVASDDQAKLIKFESITFVDIDAGQTFSNGTNYTITDGLEEFVVRTDFWNVDYIGEEIPLTAISLAGVVLQYQETLQLIPRFAADFDDAGEPDPDPYVVSISATPDIIAQSLTIQGSVFGDVEEVSIGALISVDENDYPDDVLGHEPFMLEVSDGAFAITLVEGGAWPGGDSWHGLQNGVHQIRAAILDDQGGIADFKDSNEFIVTEIIEVPTLSELREMPADGSLYKYTGNAVIVAMDGFRNRKFIQDETAAILIDDNPGIISTEYELYDVITNVIGKTNIHLNMLQFQPEANTEPATENTPVDPYLFNLDEVTSDDQAKLVQFENVTFTGIEDGQNFANGTNYVITDGVNEFVLRTDFWNVDFIGEEIPQSPQNISGVILQHIDSFQLVPRFAADFEDAEIEDPSFTVTFQVVDADGFSIDNAIITLGDLVNDAGDYVFEDIAEGTYNYNVSALCFSETGGEVIVDDDKLIEIELALLILPGDANGDGSVNVLDIIVTANYYAGITPSNFCFHNADVNNDGAINILDIIATVNIYASGK